VPPGRHSEEEQRSAPWHRVVSEGGRLGTVKLDALGRSQEVPLLVPTPGHSYGHLSVLLGDDERSYLFAGDLACSEARLRAHVMLP
jgi:glyoxylase-like metal-dependent hydrolase (beta-lactamase superfamily II)